MSLRCVRKTDLIDAIKLALSKNILVVAVSQCIDSRVDLTAYALGRTLFEMGVVSGVDMTTECVAAKVRFTASGMRYIKPRLFVSLLCGTREYIGLGDSTTPLLGCT